MSLKETPWLTAVTPPTAMGTIVFCRSGRNSSTLKKALDMYWAWSGKAENAEKESSFLKGLLKKYQTDLNAADEEGVKVLRAQEKIVKIDSEEQSNDSE